MKKSNILKAAFLAALAMVALFAFTACGTSPDESKKMITDSLNEEFAMIQNPENFNLSEIFAQSNSAELEKMKLDGDTIAQSVYGGFDYAVDEVVVDGDKAVATITVSGKSSSEIKAKLANLETEIPNLLQAEMDARANDPSKGEMTEDEIYEFSGVQFMKAFEEAPVVTETIQIHYVIENETWVAKDTEEVLAATDIAALKGF